MPFSKATSSNSNHQASSSSSNQQQQHQNKSGAVPPELFQCFPCEDLRDAAIFYFAADIGDFNANRPLAEQMEKLARKTRPPDQIILGGDNFYPNAASTKEEAKQDFHSWRARFIFGALEHVVFKICIGNHDRSGNIQFQLDYTNSPENPNGQWQCRGDDPNEKPSPNYTYSCPVYSRTSDLAKVQAIAKKQAQQEEQRLIQLQREREEAEADEEKRKAEETGKTEDTVKDDKTVEHNDEQKDDDEEEDVKEKNNGDDENNDDDQQVKKETTNNDDDEEKSAKNLKDEIDASSAKNSTKVKTAASNSASKSSITTSSAQASASSTSSSSSAPLITTHHPRTGSTLAGRIHFTVFETNVASGVVRRNPELLSEWPSNCEWLYKTLETQDKQKDTLFKVVLGHHALYAVGHGHFLQGLSLRAKNGKSVSHNGAQKVGLGFENILVRSKVDAYLCGHEHLLSCSDRTGDVCHCVVGATAHYEIYGGKVTGNEAQTFDWIGPNSKRGFLVGCATADLESKTATLTLSFIAIDPLGASNGKQSPPGSVMHVKTITKSI